MLSTALADEGEQFTEKEEEYLHEIEGEGGFSLVHDEGLVRAKLSISRRFMHHAYFGVYGQYESPDHVLGVIGPTFSWTRQLKSGFERRFELVLGVGLETSPVPFVGLSRIVYQHNHVDINVLLTLSTAGLWYEGSILLRIGPLGLGPYLQKEDGVAPRAAIYMGDFTILVTAPTYNWTTKGTNLIAGLKWQPKH